jgi:hypothetical protein
MGKPPSIACNGSCEAAAWRLLCPVDLRAGDAFGPALARQIALLMMSVIFVVMCGPRPNGGAEDDGVHIGAHSVLNVSGHQQIASHRITLCSAFVQRIPERYLQLTFDDDDAGVLAVPMVFPISCWNEKCISERFAIRVFVAFQDSPLRAVLINILPHNALGIPRLR